MHRTANRWTGGRSAAHLGILILGIALAIAPEAHAWGRFGYGRFGGGGFMVVEKAPASALVKDLPIVGAASSMSIQAGARVRSSRPIAASATPGPFSKAASIPRIREFPAARRPSWVHRRADCSGEPPREQPWEQLGAPSAETREKARRLALAQGLFSAGCGGGGGPSGRSFSRLAIWSSSRAR
jgi:hypothetical protein